MTDGLRSHYLDAIVYRTRLVLWWPAAVLLAIGIFAFVVGQLAGRGGAPPHLVDSWLVTSLSLYLEAYSCCLIGY